MIDVLLIHPEHRSFGKNDILPMGTIGVMNSLECGKLGVFMAEAGSRLISGAGIIAMDLHWYLSMRSVFSAAEKIKAVNPHVKVIVGGYTATVFADFIVRKTDVDFVVAGDAEGPFKALVENLLAGGSGEGVPNVVARDFAAPRSFHLTRDVYDSGDYLTVDWFPSFKKLALKYQKNRFPVTTYPFVPVFKGCIHDCEFCYGSPKMQMKLCGRGRVTRSPGRVKEDLERLSRDPDIRTACMIMDFVESPGAAYSSVVFSEKYDLNLYYEFFNFPAVEELDRMLACFNRCFLYFPLVVNHIGNTGAGDFGQLAEILKCLKGKNCACVAWVNLQLAREDGGYRAGALGLRKSFGVDFMNGCSELIPVPGLGDDPGKLAGEFEEYLGKSGKKTISGVFLRTILPVVFRSSLLLYFSRKTYSALIAAALRFAGVRRSRR